jgi:anti-sigma regulatory factor (Ser/Thr protein kinase)
MDNGRMKALIWDKGGFGQGQDRYGQGPDRLGQGPSSPSLGLGKF